MSGDALVFLHSAVGDQVLAWPALRALSRVFPNRLRLITCSGMPRFLFWDLPIRERLVIDVDPHAPAIDVEREASRIAPAEAFISLTTFPEPTFAQFARRMATRTCVGFAEGFDRRIPLDAQSNFFDKYFAAPLAFDDSLRIEDFAGAPFLPEVIEEDARAYLGRINPAGRKILFVHPETKPHKMWTREGWRALLGRFLDQYPDYLAIVSSCLDYGFETIAPPERIVVSHEPLAMSFALLRYADLFAGVDSCFLHVADLYRVPGIALFGPTDPRSWGFRFSAPHAHLTLSGERAYEALAELSREKEKHSVKAECDELPGEDRRRQRLQPAIPQPPRDGGVLGESRGEGGLRLQR